MKPAVITILLFLMIACNNDISSNKAMIQLLAEVAKYENDPKNSFASSAKLAFFDSLLKVAKSSLERDAINFSRSKIFLELGEEREAISVLEGVTKSSGFFYDPRSVDAMKTLAMAYMRLGERTNCIYNHGMKSCLMPVEGSGIHVNKLGSSKAIEIYQKLLKLNPNDLESRWLLNIAYMTIGGYPDKVPSQLLIPGLTDTSHIVRPFTDVSAGVGLDTKNVAGGSIVDDFNNDGYLDIVTSGWNLGEKMHYCRNNADGTFTDVSDSSKLSGFTGGLNMVQMDYNNDGYKDIFVLRGAWKGIYGREPNSLLRNNGDGTFTDVTQESGLLSFHPTQTATWNDFNNDGWVDVFIGNESMVQNGDINPCELYLNNKNGTFTDISSQSGTGISAFVKGVTSGDYDNDGWADIFLSTRDGREILFKNEGIKDGIVHFKDVTAQAGLGNLHALTFPTWFWDYDNDGWLDILVCGYEFDKSLANYAAAEALKLPVGHSNWQFLFRNKHDGTFEDVTEQVGLNKIAFAMGANFGDIDNDGYPDFYLGTGNPLYQSLVPNKMFKNDEAKKFIDVTIPARVGNLQKGHAVSFADLDNDGDQDIYVEMGGAYPGDAYLNSMFINPGQNNNNWINLSLEGTKSNRAAIGARIKVTFEEKGKRRSVYRDVNSGASFGANPLMQHIGIGSAAVIESIEINWPASHITQVFRNVQPDETIKIKEGIPSFSKISVRKIDYSSVRSGLIPCR